LAAAIRLCVVMADDPSDLIEQLLAEAAAIMEDASAAILIADRTTMAARAHHVTQTGAALISFGEAANTLLSLRKLI